MTPPHRLGAGLLLATASCGIAPFLAESPEGRVVVVTLFVVSYTASVVDLAAAMCAAVMVWALSVAFLLGTERLAHTPVTLAALMAAAVAGTVYGRCTRR